MTAECLADRPMVIRREDGFEIDTAAGRLDVALVHRWLSGDAYWALGRPVEVVVRTIETSLCFGVYAPSGPQVGFARAVTDYATFAWLCDVYIDHASRALGLGTWLAATVRDTLAGYGVRRILLATADAHGVYASAGFAPLAEPARWMELDVRPVPRPIPGA